MKLEYATIKDEDLFTLTNFTCHPSLALLNKKGLFKIIWSRSEEVSLNIDGYTIDLQPGQAVFCTPLNVVEVDKSSKDLICYIFNKEFFCIQTQDEAVSCNGFLFFGSSQPQVVTLKEREKALFENMLLLFEEELKLKDNFQGEMLRTLLKRLLLLSNRILKKEIKEPELPNAQLDLIRQYNLLVEQHFREKHKVKDYAELLFKSPKTLSNLFNKYNNKPPLTIINERILLEAKRLLLYSDRSNEEISYELGYNDSAHFSKFFKNNEGISPTSFKSERLKRNSALN